MHAASRFPVTAPFAANVHFLPDDLWITARPGELLLDCARRAGVKIPSGCLLGHCHACEVEIVGHGPACACITAIPPGQDMAVQIAGDLIW